ncbi:MAG: nucleolar RNA-binding Nop10p family protein [Candidatus Bilamarchaeaceae archaeon]
MKCPECGAYTFKEVHCVSRSESAHPAPFNWRDPHGGHRRRVLYGEHDDR